MQAAVVRRFGPPDVLVTEAVPDPTVGPGQALVDVEYAGTTFVETQIRAGRPPNPAMKPALPWIPGNGAGGRVLAVGDGVDPATIGRAVVTTTGGRDGYAERVAVDAGQLIEVPDDVTIADAVALLADGRTALALTQLAAVTPGETVLVEAAAGGVGSCLVQLLKREGARVLACVGSEDKLPLVAALGADAALSYAEPSWVDDIRAQATTVDVVLDGVGGPIGAAAAGLLRDGGRLLSYGMAGGAFTEAAQHRERITVARGTNLDPRRARELSAAALALSAAGHLRPVVGQVRPLAEAADAHAAIESRRTVGKTLLRIG